MEVLLSWEELEKVVLVGVPLERVLEHVLGVVKFGVERLELATSHHHLLALFLFAQPCY